MIASRSRSIARTILEPLALAVALALIVRSFLHIYKIPSASMEPTLQTGDVIVVTRYFRGEPQRGDVVVFRSGNELVVKRVIATPGELVDSHEGRVRIGGYAISEPYARGATGAMQAQLVAPESFFVLGDNRGVSEDSRAWGPVRRERIVGRARFVLWSARRGQRLFQRIE
ncbi:MAG TPA: signal peptidase I [Thermoanaerobaculia bacterium]